MYQQQVPQPRDENNWSSPESEYEAGYTGNVQQSDQLADAIARRLQSQSPSHAPISAPPSFQFRQNPTTVTAGMRLALAIVSIGVLIPIAALAFPILGAFSGLVGFGCACVAILGINALFSRH